MTRVVHRCQKSRCGPSAGPGRALAGMKFSCRPRPARTRRRTPPGQRAAAGRGVPASSAGFVAKAVSPGAPAATPSPLRQGHPASLTTTEVPAFTGQRSIG
jgi:hypothetical protein